MKVIKFDSGFFLDDPNNRWGNPSYQLEPGDPGYVPPSPPSTPTINKIMNHKPHCPVPIIIYNGNGNNRNIPILRIGNIMDTVNVGTIAEAISAIFTKIIYAMEVSLSSLDLQ